MMERRSFLASLPASALAQQRKPNVLIFLTDDMGYADIGCFGAKDISTPNIDRLARQGVRFTHCYSNGPVCTPTRAALMTGRYQQRMGLEWALMPADNPKGLTQRETTVAKYLKGQGYRTGLFGKWHLGMVGETLPNRHGFDEFHGLLSGNVDMYSHQRREGTADWWRNEQPVREQGYGTELIARSAEEWLKKVGGDPFFCYVAFNAVHWPFQGPGRPQDERNRDTWMDGTRAGDYKPMLEAMDAAVGRVLAAVDGVKAAENTIVIFTNDNGGERLSHSRPFFHHKATLWEGGIRVPGIVKWPGISRPGTVSQQAVASMDFAATILGACGVRAGNPLDGMDLKPFVADPRKTVDRPLCWRINRADRKQKAVRHGKWKLVLDGEIHQLFDLLADPGERVDLAMEHPGILQEMRGRLSAWEKDLASTPPPFPAVL